MEITQATRTQLFFEIEQLSSRYLAELESFVQYLKFKQASTETAADPKKHVLPPEDDPILRVIGAIDAEPFADNIDDALYSSL